MVLLISFRHIPHAKFGVCLALSCVAMLSNARFLLTFQSAFQVTSTSFQGAPVVPLTSSAVDVVLDVPVQVQVQVVTHWNDTSRKTPPTIYFCKGDDGNGMRENKQVMRSALPEYRLEDMSKSQKMVGRYKDSNEYDIFINPSSPTCASTVFHWLVTHFNGHVVLFSGESDEEDPVQGANKPKVHGFGPVRTPRTEDITLYYMQLVWWDLFQTALPPLAMTDPSHRPKGKRTNYMIYANSNCVPFREEAVGRLSEFGRVHVGGKCPGRPPRRSSGDRSNLTKIATGVNLRNWWDNTRVYSEYRFCFVMEHVNHAAYITEKILMAFIGGCIPIYYGASGVFDIFNEKAFIFYNISDPQPALDKMKALESDKELYEQMFQEPIAAHGDATIEKYFSFSDDVGHGVLKQRIRETLGISNLVP
jgi:hypothetical protein